MRTEDPKKKKRRTVRDLMPATEQSVMSGSWQPPKHPTGQTANERLRKIGPAIGMGLASMLPGVGEAIDAHDLATGLRDGQYGKAALGGLGLALPFVAMGSLKRVGGEVADALTPAKRPTVPWSKAPQEARDEYLNSLEGVRNPMRATDLVSGARGPEVPEVPLNLRNVASLGALVALLRGKQGPPRPTNSEI